MKHLSEINRLIQTVSASADLLEPAAFSAVCDFLRQSQSGSGAFMDRGGRPDWYYSFFGFMICKAFGLKDELNRLRHFATNSNRIDERNLTDWLVWILLRDEYKRGSWFRLKISVKLVSRWMKERDNPAHVYLTFIMLLILNHFWGWSRCISGQINRLTSISRLSEHSPTSHLAAAVCIRSHLSLDTEELVALLIRNAHPGGGFVSFYGSPTTDMLSTAVAVYALTQANAGIKPIIADGFAYVSSHFNNGAFIPGDGDQARDVEYTFYGLLALSAYARPLKEKQK